MSEIKIKVNKADILKIRKTLNGLSPVDRATIVYKSIQKSTHETEGRMKVNVSGSILNRRTGRLATSIGSKTFIDGAGVKGVVGSGVRFGARVNYADILETGGTIHAKPGKWLTVPLKAAKTKAGTTRYPEARDYPNTFLKKSRAGNLIIFQKIGKTAIRPLFVLKKSVNIPPFLYLSKTASQMSKRIIGNIQAAINQATKK